MLDGSIALPPRPAAKRAGQRPASLLFSQRLMIGKYQTPGQQGAPLFELSPPGNQPALPGFQNGSSMGRNSTGISVTNDFSHSAQYFIPHCSDIM